jgi:hypothetical protein
MVTAAFLPFRTDARFVVGLFVLLLTACSQPAGPAAEATPPASAASAANAANTPAASANLAGKVVIARLVTHDSKVAILGGGELRVAIEKMDGTLVADGLTLSELRTQDPEVYQVVTSSFAGSGYVDATLDLGHLN